MPVAERRTVKLRVDPSRAEEWDIAVHRANTTYSERMHNLFCDNCHSHVANVLNTFA